MTDTPQGSERGIDGLFEALADRQRRRIVRALDGADGGVAVSDLADRIAVADENAGGSPSDGGATATRRRVRASLLQVHLPLLADAGVAERGSDDVVRPGPELDAALALLESGPEPVETNDAMRRSP